MNNDELFEKINKRFDTLEQGQKQLEQGQKEQGSAIARLEQGQAQTNTILAQHTTAFQPEQQRNVMMERIVLVSTIAAHVQAMAV